MTSTALVAALRERIAWLTKTAPVARRDAAEFYDLMALEYTALIHVIERAAQAGDAEPKPCQMVRLPRDDAAADTYTQWRCDKCQKFFSLWGDEHPSCAHAPPVPKAGPDTLGEQGPFPCKCNRRTLACNWPRCEAGEAAKAAPTQPIEAMAKALEKAASWFDEYAAAHRAKATPEADAKARTNEARSQVLRAALAVQPSPDTRPHMHGCVLPEDHTGTCERPSNPGPRIEDLAPGQYLLVIHGDGSGAIFLYRSGMPIEKVQSWPSPAAKERG